jgi:hypothetical protein
MTVKGVFKTKSRRKYEETAKVEEDSKEEVRREKGVGG